MAYIRGIARDASDNPVAGRTVRVCRLDTGAVLATAVTGNGSSPLVPGDAAAANKVLLLNFEGANNSTTFTDSSVKARTPSVVGGDAKISTSQSKFGTASGYFDGVGDYVSWADSEDWNPGTGDMTFHCWVRPDVTAPATQGRICGQCTFGGGQSPLVLTQATSGVFNLSTYDGAGFQGITSTIASTAFTWRHLAAMKYGTSMIFAVDGFVQGSFTIGNGGQLFNSADPFSIGRMGAFADQYYKGFLDDFEIVKGVALWTTDFTPPLAKRSSVTAGSGGAVGEYMFDLGGYTGAVIVYEVDVANATIKPQIHRATPKA